ncbi:MAG: glycosyltransferase family 9 protein [Bacteroidetes bacterium]|nr:glycosyltransferase family 9 protein [Bacteroidota bacterium]
MADPVLRILVSRLRFIGDIILTTPVLESLRSKFPGAEIDYLGDSGGVTLLENNPYLNEIIPYDFKSFEVKEQIRVGYKLRRKKYDVAIDLFGNPRSAIVIRLSGAGMRIGGNFGWRRKTYTHPIRIGERLTSVAFHLKYLEPLGIHESYRQPRIFLTETEIKDAREVLKSRGVDFSKPVVGLHIGATWPSKVWFASSFARLAELVHERLGAQVVVTYGPNDTEYFELFAPAAGVKCVTLPPGSLRFLASAISCCDAYVSNDASPMHISAAVGTPAIGIFGPGEPDIWFPYDRKLGHVALKKEVDCCHSDFCKLEGEDYMRCMKAVKPEEVCETIEQVLKERKRVKQ